MARTINEYRPSPEVGANKRFVMQPVSGAAMGFTPAASNAGGFPLLAWWDDDLTTAFLIRGPQFIKGNLEAQSLTVDTSMGGGQLGDSWQVTISPEASTGEGFRPRTDVDGILMTRPAGSRALVNITLSPDSGAFTTAWGNGQQGNFYITPDARGDFTAGPVPELASSTAWDVSRFTRLLLICDAKAGDTQYPGGADMEFGIFADACHSPTSRPFKTYAMGTVNNFGSAGGTPWNGDPGIIALGSGAEASTAYTRDVLTLPPFLRFRITVASNGMDAAMWTELLTEGGNITLRALAW